MTTLTERFIKFKSLIISLLWSYKMIPNNTYQSEFNRRPEYMAGRAYQNQSDQNQSYQNQSYQSQSFYQNQSRTPHAYCRSNSQVNHDTALAALPAELGGDMPGNRSRFSGSPNW